jgi:hypothetical protein
MHDKRLRGSGKTESRAESTLGEGRSGKLGGHGTG